MANSIAVGSGQPESDKDHQAQTSVQTQEQQQQAAPEKGWLDSLPDELKGSDSLKKFKDVPGLAKSYVELEKHLGGTLKMPNDTSKPEEWEAFYNKLGRPEKPEGYGFKAPETLPPGVEWNEDLAKEFSTVAHKYGLTKNQASAMVEMWQGIVTKQAEGYWTQEKGLASLHKDFKTDDEINAHVAHVQRGVKELADPDFIELLDTTGLGNDPVMMKFLAKVGKLFDEDTLPDNFQPGEGGMSVDQAKSEIARIRNDRTHPYHKGDKEAVAYMSKLYESAHGRKVVLEVK
jgi:hypothetical protein